MHVRDASRNNMSVVVGIGCGEWESDWQQSEQTPRLLAWTTCHVPEVEILEDFGGRAFISILNTLEFEMPTEQPEGVVSWAKVAHLIRNLGKGKNFPSSSDSKESSCNAGDLGSIHGWGRPLGEGHGNPLQYSCLGNPTDRGAWWATVYGVTKNRTQLSD